MSLKLRIRQELDKNNGLNLYGVVDTIVEQGVNEEELREVLIDIVREVARQRAPKPFLSDSKFKEVMHDPVPDPEDEPNAPEIEEYVPRKAPIPTTSSRQPGSLLPNSKPVTYTGSDKVKGYQASRLDERYFVGNGQYKKLSEMNREDVRFNIRMLQGNVKAIEGRIKGWEAILNQLMSYQVNVVEELPDNVKQAI